MSPCRLGLPAGYSQPAQPSFSLWHCSKLYPLEDSFVIHANCAYYFNIYYCGSGCYYRTSLCLFYMSPVPLWKNKFSKASFGCSVAFLHALLWNPALGRKPKSAQRTAAHLLFQDFAWSKRSCYEMGAMVFPPFPLQWLGVRVSFLKLSVPYFLNNKMKQ